jgi:hypothetical protein
MINSGESINQSINQSKKLEQVTVEPSLLLSLLAFCISNESHQYSKLRLFNFTQNWAKRLTIYMQKFMTEIHDENYIIQNLTQTFYE